MTPSPAAAAAKNQFRLEARNAGVGAFHVIPSSDEINNNNNINDSFSTVAVSDRDAILTQQQQESLQRGVIVAVSDSEAIEEVSVELAATSTPSIRDAYLKSIKRKSCIGEDDGNGEFGRGTTGAPTASLYYCDETRLLPAIDSETIVTRTDRFQALQSVLETEL
eukprot:scaffold152270_cov53-Attheya_sp.AAC.1